MFTPPHGHSFRLPPKLHEVCAKLDNKHTTFTMSKCMHPPSKLHRFVNVSIFKTDLVTKDTGIKRQEIRTRTRAEKSGSQSNRFTFQKTIPEHWSNRTCGISRLPKILCRAATNQTVLASLCVSCPLARLVHHGALPTTRFTIQPWPAATFPFISPS